LCIRSPNVQIVVSRCRHRQPPSLAALRRAGWLPCRMEVLQAMPGCPVSLLLLLLLLFFLFYRLAQARMSRAFMIGKLHWCLVGRHRDCMSAAALLDYSVLFLLLRFPAISKRIQLLHALLGHRPQYDHLFRQQGIYQKSRRFRPPGRINLLYLFY